MRQIDINFALTIILHALMPPTKQQVMPPVSGSTKQRHLSVSESSVGRTASVMSRHGRNKATFGPHETLQNIAFLGNNTKPHWTNKCFIFEQDNGTHVDKDQFSTARRTSM